MEDQNILSGVDVVRAWKDSEYKFSLTGEQQSALPEAPANLDDLSDEELEEIAGGTIIITAYCPIKPA